jgi:hypothetical protein
LSEIGTLANRAVQALSTARSEATNCALIF